MPSLQESGWGIEKGHFRYHDTRETLIHEIKEWIVMIADMQVNLPYPQDEAVVEELEGDAEYISDLNLRFFAYKNEINSLHFDVLNHMNKGITSSAEEIVQNSRKVALFLETCSLNPTQYRRTEAKAQIQIVLSSLNNLAFYCQY